MSLIEVNRLEKVFKVFKREKGSLNVIKSIFKRKYEIIKAVNSITFNIEEGELVGYIGPNGAGKSTTIKMLSGILVPTSGIVKVDGKIPYLNRKENAMNIGAIFGQRSQLYWDLPVLDSFELYKKIYRIGNLDFKRNVEFYTELLDMQEFIKMPARQLSLGQKMRANIAIALLHDPGIVYLDEPTIGLDIMAKSKIRTFIKEVNKEKKTTILLTTHDMDDIEQICDRLIIIDKGTILYDDKLKAFKEKYNKDFMITVVFNNDIKTLPDTRFKIIKEDGPKKHILIKKDDLSFIEAVKFLSNSYDIVDLSYKEPEIEELIIGFISK